MNIPMEAIATYAKLKESVIKDISEHIGNTFDISLMSFRYRADGTCEELYYMNDYMGKFTIQSMMKQDGTPTFLVTFTPTYTKEGK